MVLAILVVASLTLRGQVGTLEVAPTQLAVDEEAGLVLCRLDRPTLPAPGAEPFTRVCARNTYDFTPPVAQLEVGVPYPVTSAGKQYRLYFTQLPLLRLSTDRAIPDEPKIAAAFTYGDADQNLEGVLGIEIRGEFSRTYPKTSFDLEFWEDATGEENRDVHFGNLREDDDWVLDALYNEPLRVNAYVAHQLWLDIHRPYYRAQDERARAGADVMWCEVFLNDRYQGIYLLSEQIDRKLLRIKKYQEEENRIRGKLYKSVRWSEPTKFDGTLSRFNNTEAALDGYELKYPDPDDAIDWSDLADLLEFTVNSTRAEFAAGIGDRFALDNLVDYFLYLNLTGAEDNSGKNIYTARYAAEEPYFFVPWDLDGTFGNRWDGSNYPWTRSVLTNGLFYRLTISNAAGFNDALCRRYAALEANRVFSPAALRERIHQQYDYLQANGVYEREAIRWPGGFLDTTAAKLAYTDNWLAERTNFLSNWVCNIPTSTDTFPAGGGLVVYPNPSAGRLTFALPPLKVTEWQLSDLTGRLLAAGDLARGQAELRLPRTTPGLYLLRLGTVTHRIVLR